MPPCRPSTLLLAAMLALMAPLAPEVHAEQPTTERAVPTGAAPPDFAAIVGRTGGAVVAIRTRQIVVPDLPTGLPESLADGLRERGALQPRVGQATGSGFFVTGAGHIVTNNHVIDRATEIEVVFDDGTSHDAELVGTDPATDIAVLRVDPSALSAGPPVVAAWGDSDALRRGSWTIAVGSPFGLGGTVTVGVLSARQRDIEAGAHDGFLQTDAAINVGNSGGPLFDVEGKVVGVNTAIFSPTGASVGIGFAVPSNTAERVVAQLIETGEVRRGFIGVELQDLDGLLAEALGYSRYEGALVGGVDPDGPAEAAGLEPGDLIVRLDGRPVVKARDLIRAVADMEPGAEVALGFVRGDGEEMTASVSLGSEPRAEPVTLGLVGIEEDRRLGLTLRPLSESLRAEFGPDAHGVVVRGVRPGGLGAERGVRRGDLITEAGRLPVDQPRDVAEAWDAAKREARPLLLQIRRGATSLYVAIEG